MDKGSLRIQCVIQNFKQKILIISQTRLMHCFFTAALKLLLTTTTHAGLILTRDVRYLTFYSDTDTRYFLAKRNQITSVLWPNCQKNILSNGNARLFQKWKRKAKIISNHGLSLTSECERINKE